ncbi:MAG: efflux RND transporter periplasmic adaptor subunit, partial [Bacteroidota bacterium]
AGQVQRLVTVTRGDLNLVVSADGVVQPINLVEVKSKASGQIVELTFEEGQEVQKGGLLIALDKTTAKNDFDQAKADLAVAESNAQQQENNFRRATELFQKSLISEQDRDQAELENVRARAQLVKARAALSSADERLRDTRVMSPITGVILTKTVELGQIISSGVSNVGGGTLLATIADMNQVHVETNVDEVDIGRVVVGQSARVVADAYPDEPFTGEVIRIAPLGKTQQNVTTFNVIVLVRNLGGKLKAGMSASVDIEIFRRQNVVLVPTEALKDPNTEQGQVILASIKKTDTAGEAAEPDTAKKEEFDMSDPQAMRERFQSMSPDQQAEFRRQTQERIQRMSPEERQQFFAQRRGQAGGQGGGFGGESRGRRTSQLNNRNAERQRVVLVREGNEFVGRMVKVGVNNFDFAEVIEGLAEGDELLVTSISRAKLAAEQFNERMRTMQSPLGGGSATRAATGRR